MIEELLESQEFITADGHELLVIEHNDSTDGHRLSPLVVVRNDKGVRVSIGVFHNGKLEPGQSVTFDNDGKPVSGVNVWGESVDVDECWGEIKSLIEDHYMA